MPWWSRRPLATDGEDGDIDWNYLRTDRLRRPAGLRGLRAICVFSDGNHQPQGARAVTKILVVDDSPDMAGLLAKIVEDQQYEVLTATSGKQALAWPRRNPSTPFSWT